MNCPFLKMLRFEWKRNLITINLLFLSIFLFVMALIMQIPGKGMNAQFIFIYLFVILVQQGIRHFNNETLFAHSMQMYLLIPVSQKIKYFSKLCVALVIYPALVLFTGYISVSLAHFVTGKPININSSELMGHPLLVFIELFVLSSSLATLTAILAKKNASLMFLMAYIILPVVTFLVYWLLGWCSNFESFYKLINSQIQNTSGVAVLFLSVLFYGISYHLFFRRQL